MVNKKNKDFSDPTANGANAVLAAKKRTRLRLFGGIGRRFALEGDDRKRRQIDHDRMRPPLPLDRVSL